MSAMISVLTSPRLTFEKIRENGGAFAIPFVILLVITLITVFLQIPVMENVMEEVEPVPGVDMEQMKQVAVVSGFIMAPLSTAASVFIGALLLLLVNLIVRGDAKYMQLAKVSVFSSVPALINGLLLGVLARTMDPASAGQVKISLAAFFDQQSGFLFNLANLINPFGLWGLAIMVIGTAVMTRKSVKSVSIWIVGGWIVINTLFAGLGGLVQ